VFGIAAAIVSATRDDAASPEPEPPSPEPEPEPPSPEPEPAPNSTRRLSSDDAAAGAGSTRALPGRPRLRQLTSSSAQPLALLRRQPEGPLLWPQPGRRTLELDPLPEPGVGLSSGLAEALVLISLNLVLLTLALGLTRRNRLRLTRAFVRMERSGETRAAAVISAFIGGIDSRKAKALAESNFRGLPFSALCEADFKAARREAETRAAGDSLSAHSVRVALGSVDAFVSHAWDDDHVAKYRALSRWAASFKQKHGREPLLWLDKACIDQSDIDNSLRVLPVYLSGCHELLIIAGPCYVDRLWCLIETFTFLCMGGDPSRLCVLLPDSREGGGAHSRSPSPSHRLSEPSGEGSKSRGRRRERLAKRFVDLDVGAANCYEADRDRLLGAIESGFDSLDEFNAACSSALLAAARTPSCGTRERSSRAGPLPGRLSRLASHISLSGLEREASSSWSGRRWGRGSSSGSELGNTSRECSGP